MSKRGGLPLSERTRVAGPLGAESAGGPVVHGDRRHCWVIEAPGTPGRWPGLLVEWRQLRAGWEGRVIYVVPEPEGEGVRVLERWLAAGYLARL